MEDAPRSPHLGDLGLAAPPVLPGEGARAGAKARGVQLQEGEAQGGPGGQVPGQEYEGPRRGGEAVGQAVVQDPGLPVSQGLQAPLVQPGAQVPEHEAGPGPLGQGGGNALGPARQVPQALEPRPEPGQAQEGRGGRGPFQGRGQEAAPRLGGEHGGGGDPLEAPARALKVDAQALGPGALDAGGGVQVAEGVPVGKLEAPPVQVHRRLVPAGLPAQGLVAPVLQGAGAQHDEGGPALLEVAARQVVQEQGRLGLVPGLEEGQGLVPQLAALGVPLDGAPGLHTVPGPVADRRGVQGGLGHRGQAGRGGEQGAQAARHGTSRGATRIC